MLTALFILLQLVRASRKWDTGQTREVAKRACFDGQSNDTRWPGTATCSGIVAGRTRCSKRTPSFEFFGMGQGYSVATASLQPSEGRNVVDKKIRAHNQRIRAELQKVKSQLVELEAPIQS